MHRRFLLLVPLLLSSSGNAQPHHLRGRRRFETATFVTRIERLHIVPPGDIAEELVRWHHWNLEQRIEDLEVNRIFVEEIKELEGGGYDDIVFKVEATQTWRVQPQILQVVEESEEEVLKVIQSYSDEAYGKELVWCLAFEAYTLCDHAPPEKPATVQLEEEESGGTPLWFVVLLAASGGATVCCMTGVWLYLCIEGHGTDERGYSYTSSTRSLKEAAAAKEEVRATNGGDGYYPTKDTYCSPSCARIVPCDPWGAVPDAPRGGFAGRKRRLSRVVVRRERATDRRLPKIRKMTRRESASLLSRMPSVSTVDTHTLEESGHEEPPRLNLPWPIQKKKKKKRKSKAAKAAGRKSSQNYRQFRRKRAREQ